MLPVTPRTMRAIAAKYSCGRQWSLEASATGAMRHRRSAATY
jgi:hypothetical protein